MVVFVIIKHLVTMTHLMLTHGWSVSAFSEVPPCTRIAAENPTGNSGSRLHFMLINNCGILQVQCSTDHAFNKETGKSMYENCI